MTNAQAIRAYVRWSQKVRPEYDRALALDAGFDGGEFSGPALEREWDARSGAVLASLGITEGHLAEAALRQIVDYPTSR